MKNYDTTEHEHINYVFRILSTNPDGILAEQNPNITTLP
jgi:hypothetical protein